MGKLVPFDKRDRPRSPRPFQPGEGQVVIFTGIRYERTQAPVPENNTPNPAKPRRKRG